MGGSAPAGSQLRRRHRRRAASRTASTCAGTPTRSPTSSGTKWSGRNSTDPLWTHAINVGNVTDYMVVGLNKDATLFGVRAINSAGDLSPVAYAGPASS